MKLIFNSVENMGARVLQSVSSFGAIWIFLFKVLYRSITPPFRFKLLLQQLDAVGVQSIMVVALVGGFTGAVLAVNGEYTLSSFGATAYTGSLVGVSLVRELGPVLTALMVNGRAGSAMTAELGIMKITEQVDALRSMAVDPLRELMVPRILAGIITVPLLTAIFNIVGIFGGYFVGTTTLGLSSGNYMGSIIDSVGDVDVITGVVKSFVFGLCVTWIACYKGWTCSFGAVGVNRATTSAVVTASVVILVVDYFITSILTQILL